MSLNMLKHLTALKCLRQAAQTNSILQHGINGTGAAWNIPKGFPGDYVKHKIYVPENRSYFTRPVCEV